jgi:uncharacterized glyoxalase superfamily protein PhnB
MDAEEERPAVVRNRSVPTDTVLPHLVYGDIAAALQWLTTTFRFSEYYRYGPPDHPQGAQMRIGSGWMMLESVRPGRPGSAQTGQAGHYLTVFVADVVAHYARTQAAGARIVEELNETVYGERQYVAEDLEGYRWLFSQHIRDVSPEDWGARVFRGPATPL